MDTPNSFSSQKFINQNLSGRLRSSLIEVIREVALYESTPGPLFQHSGHRRSDASLATFSQTAIRKLRRTAK